MKTLTIEKINVPAPSGRFIQILDFWYDIPPHLPWFEAIGAPVQVNSTPGVTQMVSLSADIPVSITKPVADWIYRTMAEVFPTSSRLEIVKTLLNLYQGRKAFTNNTGWDELGGNRIEYWSGEDQTGKKEPIGLQYVCSIGSTYKVLGEGSLFGNPVWKIEAMDVFDPSTLTKTYKGNEHLFTIATVNSRDDTRAERFKTNPFPHNPPIYNRTYDNYTRVIVPVLANHRNYLYIKKMYCKELHAGSTIPAYPYRYP